MALQFLIVSSQLKLANTFFLKANTAGEAPAAEKRQKLYRGP